MSYVKDLSAEHMWYVLNFGLVMEKEGNREAGTPKSFKFRIDKNLFGREWTNNIHMFKQRMEECVKILKSQGYNIVEIKMSVKWKLSIGLGYPTPTETSLQIHHTYGVPYIPSSAIKGVLRHWLEQWKVINYIASVPLAEVFGKTKGRNDGYSSRGKVIFFDAFPEKVEVDLDIINVHYPKYYAGLEPPHDAQNPNPVHFPVVVKGEFKFIVGSKDLGNEVLNTLMHELKEALATIGIGAKTRSGYGRFEI